MFTKLVSISGPGFTTCGLLVLAVITTAAASTPVAATVITDGFEGPTISSLWDVSKQQNGSLSLSTTVAHSGSQSLRATAAGGGQVDVWAIHDFGQPMLGEFSVWFYDTRVGRPYANLVMENTQQGVSTGVGIRDWDGTYYHAGYGPGEGQTSVPRSVGWHGFKVVADGTTHDFYIDGALVSSAARSTGFDRVWLTITGPSVTGTYYYDDFYASVQPVPEPNGLALAGLAAAGASWRRRRDHAAM